MNSPARVLYVHHGGGQGGAANSLLYLLQKLDRSRFEPLVSCNFKAAKAREYFGAHGFETLGLSLAPFAHSSKTWELTTARGMAKFLRWATVSQPAARRSLRNLLITLKPDLVHLNGISLLPLARTVTTFGVPVVQHIRESVNEGKFGFRKNWLARIAQRNCAHLVYICEDGRRRFPVAECDCSVIYDPVPFDKFTVGEGRNCRANLGIPADSPALFFPGGSMLDIKGIVPFLLALSRIRSVYPNVVALIPGIDGLPHPRDATRSAVEDIIANGNLEPSVRRVPFSDNVEQYYLASDIVVAPFIKPHFSRAVVEAGAMSRPVVGSRMDAIEEVLEDGVVGLLTRTNDANDLAEKLCYLIANRDEAVRMGQAGYDAARRRYDAIGHAAKIMQIYGDVLPGRVATS